MIAATGPLTRLQETHTEALVETIIAVADLFADEGDYDTGLKIAELADRVTAGEVAA